MPTLLRMPEVAANATEAVLADWLGDVVAGAAQVTAHDEQPGAEDGRGVGALGVLEERGVDRAGGVVEGQEDDPAARPDRWGLGGDLDPGDQQLGAAAARKQVLAAGDAELVEEAGVVVDDVAAHVEAEDLDADTPRAVTISRRP